VAAHNSCDTVIHILMSNMRFVFGPPTTHTTEEVFIGKGMKQDEGSSTREDAGSRTKTRAMKRTREGGQVQGREGKDNG